ncbi:hypothetical protein ACFL6I_19820 [candidate division KSB1 bacterium]
MKLFVLFILFFSFCFQKYSCGQQKDSIASEPPIIKYVTVDSTNGIAILHWTPSISQDVLCYVIYKYMWNNWVPVDTVWGSTSNYYKNINSQADLISESYSIVAMDSSNNFSTLAPFHTSIYLSDTTVNSTTIKLLWNHYVGWDTIDHYNVYHKTPNSNNYIIRTQLPATLDTYYYFITLPDSQYCYYIEAVRLDGRRSQSERSCNFAVGINDKESNENKNAFSICLDHTNDRILINNHRKNNICQYCI